MNDHPHKIVPAKALVLLKGALSTAMLLIIFYEILGGVIKYLCIKSSMLFLSYIPSLFGIAVVISYYAYYGAAMRLHRSTGVFLALFVINISIGLLLGRHPGSIALACYLWSPFFIGLLFSIFQLEDTFLKKVPIFWFIAVIGILLNSQISFPWTGETYEVLGKTMQASKQWWAIGVERFSGFSRSSSITAIEITLPCIILLCTNIRLAYKIIIWLLSVIAVYLTTSKITLLITIVTPILLMLAVRRNSSKTKQIASISSSSITHRKGFIKSSLIAMSLVVILTPIFSLSEKSRSLNFASYGFISLASLYDRMAYMWPSAWNLLLDDDNPIAIASGRGLGGIGTAQTFFEPSRFNAGDNLFVYLHVTFGIASLLFFWYLLTGYRKWPKQDFRKHLIYYGMTVFVFLNGITSNGIESPYIAFVTGLLIGKSMEPTKNFLQHPPSTGQTS